MSSLCQANKTLFAYSDSVNRRVLNGSPYNFSRSSFELKFIFAWQVNAISKMPGPVGPPGYNGSRGVNGSQGLAGPPGPKGAGSFSQCVYKFKGGTSATSNGLAKTDAFATEPSVSILPSDNIRSGRVPLMRTLSSIGPAMDASFGNVKLTLANPTHLPPPTFSCTH